MKQDFQENKVVTGKTPFFVIGPFYNCHFCVLTLASDMEDFYRNDSFSILVLKTATPILEIPETVFWKNLSVGFKMKPLRKSVLLC